MFGFGKKKKRTRLIGKSEKDGIGVLIYQCPECKSTIAGVIPLNGQSISKLKRELEMTCSSCQKEIIVENYD